MGHLVERSALTCALVGAFLCTAAGTDASSVLYSEDFTFTGSGNYQDASSALGSEWTLSSTNQGRSRIYNWGGSRGGVLVLDDWDDGNNYSRNEAILSVDLLGMTGVTLSFEEYDSKDEEHSIGTSPYTGSRNGDGLSVSSDGTTWVPVVSFGDHNGSWRGYTFDLSAIVSGSSLLQLSSNFLLKFQQYDNYQHGTDGRKFDNILLTGTPSATPPAVPEPSSMILLGVCGVGLLSRRRRQPAK